MINNLKKMEKFYYGFDNDERFATYVDRETGMEFTLSTSAAGGTVLIVSPYAGESQTYIFNYLSEAKSFINSYEYYK